MKVQDYFSFHCFLILCVWGGGGYETSVGTPKFLKVRDGVGGNFSCYAPQLKIKMQK